MNFKKFRIPKVVSMESRKACPKKFNVDQTITDSSVTTRTIINDAVFIETEFPHRNASSLKVNI